MNLQNIKISGFKNISDVDVNFNHFNALVALNNYGKSNFIEALNFSLDFIQASNKKKGQMMQSQNQIPINNSIAEKNFGFDLTFETTFKDSIVEVNYSFNFEWIKEGGKGRKITKELLRLKKKEKDSKYSTYINRDLVNKVYLNSPTGRCDKKIIIDDNALIINKLSNFDDLFYLDIINKIINTEFSFYSLSDIESKFTTGFIVNDEDNSDEEPKMSEVPSIANFFYMLKKEDSNKYELLINTIQDLLPDIEYINPIEIDLKGKSTSKKSKFIPFVLPEKVYDIRVKIKTNNQETSVKNLSTGSRRIFYVLASALISDMSDNKLLCFEELENSIHPALLQRLLMLITELTPNTKVLITSHSPHLVKYLSLDDILIGIPNCEGLASFKRIKKTKQKKLISYAKDAETNIGDFVFDMLIEGFEESSFWNDFI